MKNIYITDLDHTFLRDDLSVSEFSKDVWDSFSKTHLMGIATARTYKKTMQFVGDININIPMILLDGALIATKDKQIIDTKFIPKNLGDEIIDVGSKLDIYPFVLALKDKNLNEMFLYPDMCNNIQKEVLKKYSKDDHLVKYTKPSSAKDNFKIVYMGDENTIKELHKELKKVFKNRVKYILAPEAYTNSYFLTLLNKDADKAHGIESISNYKDFDLERLCVFGDNHNDLGMFELSKTSIAVANAQEEVKNKADVVLKHTNNEDGVARYLKSIK